MPLPHHHHPLLQLLRPAPRRLRCGARHCGLLPLAWLRLEQKQQRHSSSWSNSNTARDTTTVAATGFSPSPPPSHRPEQLLIHSVLKRHNQYQPPHHHHHHHQQQQQQRYLKRPENPLLTRLPPMPRYRGGYKGGRGGGAGGSAAAAARRPPLTHFLCVPLIHNPAIRTALETSLAQFRDAVEADGVVSSKAVRPVGTIHLTLGVMSLVDEEKVQRALDVLKSLNLREILGQVQPQPPPSTSSLSFSSSSSSSSPAKEPLILSLRGLHPMQRPDSTSVLYATPTDLSGRLLAFCEAIRARFAAGDAGVEEGAAAASASASASSSSLLVPDDRPLRLHATVVNTVYAKPGGRGHGHSRRGRGRGRGEEGRGPAEAAVAGGGDATIAAVVPFQRTFDATALLERWTDDFVWADGIRVDRVAICRMGAQKILGGEGGREVVDEAYEEVGVVMF